MDYDIFIYNYLKMLPYKFNRKIKMLEKHKMRLSAQKKNRSILNRNVSLKFNKCGLDVQHISDLKKKIYITEIRKISLKLL